MKNKLLIRYVCGIVEYVCPLTHELRELERADHYDGTGIEGHDYIQVHVARARS